MALETINLDDFDNEDEDITLETLDDEDEEEVLEDEDFEDDTDSEEDDEEEEDETSEEETDEDLEDDEDLEEDDAEEEERKPSKRENDRIRTLVEERKKAREEAAKERTARLELQKQTIELQKTMVESSKSILEDQIDAIKTQMKIAREDEDHDKYVEFQQKLNKAQQDVDALNNWEAPEVEDAPVTKPNQEHAHKWFAANRWFQEPINDDERAKRREALEYSDKLTQEGYDISTPEYFEKLDEHLTSLASDNVDDVESKKKTKKSSTGRKKKKVSKKVQGGSRTSASKKSSRNKITLTQEQLRIAELYGMTPKEYAKEVLRMEDSKKKGTKMFSIDV